MSFRPVTLAYCDGFAAKKFVYTTGRTASTLIELPDFSTFSETATKKELDLLRRLEDIYAETLKAGYSFVADAFGGHTLTTLHQRLGDNVLAFPVGLVAKIKPSEEHLFDDTSTVAATELCNLPRLLAGTIRFVNSPCDPNCRYEFTSSNGIPCVRLKTLRIIQPGEEITVFYGKHFFETLECQCPHVHLHEQELSDLPSSLSMSPESRNKKCRRPRISSLSGFMALAGVETSKSYKRKRTVRLNNSPRDSEDLRCPPMDESTDLSSEDFPIEHLDVVQPLGSSTPNHHNENTDDAEIELNNLKVCLTAIGSKHRASDALMNDVLKVFRLLKPDTDLPGIKKFKKESRKTFLENTYSQVPCNSGGLIPLRFSLELKEICCRNWEILVERSRSLISNTRNDIRLGKFINETETAITLHLIISTDGVKIIHSSGKHLYPLWIIIADLPSVLRFSFDNIALASLWFGDGKPGFEIVFQYVQREITDLKFVSHEGFSYAAIVEFVFLSADNVAKAAILNMKQFNGYFGCHLCEDEGEIVSHRQRIYPCNIVIKMRTFESYEKNLSEAQKLEAADFDPGSKSFRNRTKGVKGIEQRYMSEIKTIFEREKN